MSANSVALELVPPAQDESIVEVERALVDGLVFDPHQIESIRPLVSPAEFFDPLAKAVYRAFFENELVDGWVGLQAALEQSGDLELLGGPAGLAKIGDVATPAGLLPGMAEDIGIAALDRRIRSLARRLTDNPSDSESLDELVELREQAEGRRSRKSSHEIQLDDISFSSDRLLDLLKEPAPEPVYPGIPPAGHFSLLIAPSFSGKTSLALWVGLARIKGQAPWLGAPEREPGRVLIYTIDEAPGQVAFRAQSLAAKHPAGRFLSDYADRLTIVGPHRTVDPDKLAKLRFTEDGIQTLRRFIREAEDQGDPFTDIIIDAYSDVLPGGISDSDNEEATRIGGHLEQIAVTHGCSIQMIHHAGKPIAGGEAPDPRDLGRGASALAAKARAIFTCEEEAGLSNVRKIRTRTNLSKNPATLLLEVSADRSSDGTTVDYFRPHDPATAYPVHEYLSEEDGWISVTALARKISGTPIDDKTRPSGNLLRLAREMRSIWDGAGLVEIRTGARNAHELRRI